MILNSSSSWCSADGPPLREHSGIDNLFNHHHHHLSCDHHLDFNSSLPAPPLRTTSTSPDYNDDTPQPGQVTTNEEGRQGDGSRVQTLFAHFCSCEAASWWSSHATFLHLLVSPFCAHSFPVSLVSCGTTPVQGGRLVLISLCM